MKACHPSVRRHGVASGPGQHQTMRSWILFLWVSCVAATLSTAAPALPRLKVSENKRFLVTEDGRPFFWLGDTAWELFHRLDRRDAETYLKNRAERKFTVIQAVALAELDGLNDPNANGDRPLEKNDPTQPNEKYFSHVDFIVKRANELGMYVGFLPTWGDKWNKKWGTGPEIFTVANAEQYGEWLGRRYKDAGIVWILGAIVPPRPIATRTSHAPWPAVCAVATAARIS